MPELFIEILSEEIPARLQAFATEHFSRLLGEKFLSYGLQNIRIESYSTPRRLAFFMDDVPLEMPERVEEKRGPRVDAPNAAIEGFLKSVGLKQEECRVAETQKGKFYFADIRFPKRHMENVLPTVIETCLFELPWPKSMRWGTGCRHWIRPLQSGICIFNNSSIQFSIQINNGEEPLTIDFEQSTVGHRFLSPQSFKVRNFEDYKKLLKERFVDLAPLDRRKKILEQIQSELAKVSPFLSLKEDEDLLNEVVGLVEWPKVIVGSIDPKFMTLPEELLSTTMRVHQRYFSVLEGGRLAPYFVTVANTEPKDDGQKIACGNERVLRARLSDAQFFYQQDLKNSLFEHAEKLKDVVFHQKLGSVYEKVKRVQLFSRWLAPYFNVSEEKAEKAALLCKSDLMTQMVREFPELQGTIGMYYAQAQGVDADVARSISEHYSPKGGEDGVSENSLSQVIALADRLDSLVGFFAVQIQPTGSKDPFALRRACLGVIRIVENHQTLSLKEAFEFGYDLYELHLKNMCDVLSKAETVDELVNFFKERLRGYWRDQSIRSDYLRASWDPYMEQPLGLLRLKTMALKDFLETEDFAGAQLIQSYRRAANILAIEEQKDNHSYGGLINPDLFEFQEERALYDAVIDGEAGFQAYIKARDFSSLMGRLATLKPYIDDFFNHVTVNAVGQDKIRENRLKLLTLFKTTLETCANFSKIEE